MIVELLLQFWSHQEVLYLTEVQPGAATVYQSWIRSSVGKSITLIGSHIGNSTSTKIHIVGFRRVHVLHVKFEVQTVLEGIIGQQGNFVWTVVVQIAQIGFLHLSVHDVHIFNLTAYRTVWSQSRLKSFQFLDGTVANINKWSGVQHISRVAAVSILIKQTDLTAVVVEQTGQSGMINLSTVRIFVKLHIETSGIKILINAGSIEPFVSNTSGNIHVYLLHAIVVGTVVHNSFKIFLSQTAEWIHRIGNVTGGNGRLGWSHQSHLSQTGIATPVGRQFVNRRWIYGRQTVFVYIDILTRQTDLNLTRLVGIGCIQHDIAFAAVGLLGLNGIGNLFRLCFLYFFCFLCWNR